MNNRIITVDRLKLYHELYVKDKNGIDQETLNKINKNISIKIPRCMPERIKIADSDKIFSYKKDLNLSKINDEQDDGRGYTTLHAWVDGEIFDYLKEGSNVNIYYTVSNHPIVGEQIYSKQTIEGVKSMLDLEYNTHPSTTITWRMGELKLAGHYPHDNYTNLQVWSGNTADPLLELINYLSDNNFDNYCNSFKNKSKTFFKLYQWMKENSVSFLVEHWDGKNTQLCDARYTLDWTDRVTYGDYDPTYVNTPSEDIIKGDKISLFYNIDDGTEYKIELHQHIIFEPEKVESLSEIPVIEIEQDDDYQTIIYKIKEKFSNINTIAEFINLVLLSDNYRVSLMYLDNLEHSVNKCKYSISTDNNILYLYYTGSLDQQCEGDEYYVKLKDPEDQLEENELVSLKSRFATYNEILSIINSVLS